MIYFVGAGSGAADLITVRGMRLLERADMVVWAGSLVNGELLSCCKPTCEIHDSARLTLAETDALLQRAAREGKTCVRLHTGDPALFGAIREQMERLDAAGIGYEVVPGVSSLFAAAAALKKELTVPGVSQTVIVSRMAGRTPVPGRESIRALSAHGATMVLFLSAGMIAPLVRELLAGGAYTEQTPCAVVYKASWQDEIIVRGTLGDIAERTADAGITKTALILVGDVLGDRYELSKLYDKHFSTAFRSARIRLGFARAAFVCFTERGAHLIEDIIARCDDSAETRFVTVHCFGEGHPSLADVCAEQFAAARRGTRTLIVFVGAVGIAVRGIAPFLHDKAHDPAVLCMDEGRRFVIPLAGGHLGGANEAAQTLAQAVGALPVVTTATDGRGAWAVDVWAQGHGFALPDMAAAKRVSAAVLAGKPVLSVGIGCKKGTDSVSLAAFVRSVFAEHELSIALVGVVASIDVKKSERAIVDFASSLGVPFVTFSAAELNGVPGNFSASDFVRSATGTGCVCERAAALAGGTTADWLLVRKTARDGMTVAVAVRS